MINSHYDASSDGGLNPFPPYDFFQLIKNQLQTCSPLEESFNLYTITDPYSG